MKIFKCTQLDIMGELIVPLVTAVTSFLPHEKKTKPITSNNHGFSLIVVHQVMLIMVL